MVRRAAVPATALALLVVPAPAWAHGLTGHLPIPLWLFSWGAAVVMVVSFAALGLLWSQPRLEGDRFRPVSDALGRVLTARATEVLCGAVGVALLADQLVRLARGLRVPAAGVRDRRPRGGDRARA